MAATGWACMLLDPSAVNLNVDSGGPLRRAVFDRITGLRAHLAAGPMDFLLGHVPPLLWAARDICPWLALPEAVDFQAGLGHERVQVRMREWAAFAHLRLTGRRGLEPATPEHLERLAEALKELAQGRLRSFLP